MISIEEALNAIAAHVDGLDTEVVSLADAAGRILAEPVIADVDSPPHRKSVMDGFAVRAADIVTECQLTVVETIIAGAVPAKELTAGTCARIMTGAPLPKGADTVVMVEQAQQDGDVVTFAIDTINPGRHTLDKAASFGKGEQIFLPGHVVRPADVGLLAEVGAHQIMVRDRATAAVLPTGNELVSADTLPGPGQIRNSNGPMLVSLLKNVGLDVNDLGMARDDRDELQRKITIGLESDFLILSGGVSAGTMDLVPEILQKSGVKQVFHKVGVKPGKPIWFGVAEKAEGKKCYVFGLPGNPVSSLVGFELFVKAAVQQINGFRASDNAMFFARLVNDHEARGDRPTYWPGIWQESDTEVRTVQALRWMGSSDLRALGSANALVLFPSAKKYKAGELVRVHRFS